MLIACLDFQNTYYGNNSPYQGFSHIAKELGHHVKSISYDGSATSVLKAYEEAGQLIEDATALFIPNAKIFNVLVPDHPAHPSQIRKRVQSGAHVLVTPFLNQPDLDNWNCFLAPYDLMVTTTRIHRSIFQEPRDVSPNLTIKRSSNSFRDSRLFQGVEEVVVHSPVAIWYGNESLPLLLATENEIPVDGTKDELPLPEANLNPSTALPAEWDARELACMALWYGENDGAVLASIGPSFVDPYIEENRRLAANVIRFLCEQSNPPLSPEQLYGRIEVNLVDFVLSVVRATGPNWWADCIPEPIRLKCSELHEKEKCQRPKEAYLFLLDLKVIIEKQWKLFEPHFAAEAPKGSRGKPTALLSRLNDLRNMIAHPAKKHVAGYHFSKDDEVFLVDCDDLIRRLLHRVTTYA